MTPEEEKKLTMNPKLYYVALIAFTAAKDFTDIDSDKTVKNFQAWWLQETGVEIPDEDFWNMFNDPDGFDLSRSIKKILELK